MAKEEKKAKRKVNPALMKPKTISADLAVIVGKGPMPTSEVIKQLWVYIKKHGLQDPKKKRNIIPDEALAKIFGSKEPLDMMKMSKPIFKHIS